MACVQRHATTPEDRRRTGFRVTAAALAALAALPAFLARYPPLYDYYNWVFEGWVLAALATGARVGETLVSSAYTVALEPVPNLASPLGIGLLNLALPPGAAGRTFLTVCVLALALAFARLCRLAQGRRTAVEFLGIAWAFGFFLYKGYLSYLFGVAAALWITGRIHRSCTRAGRRIGARAAAGLTALATAAYFMHLVSWAVILAALFVYTLWLFRRGRRAEAYRLALTPLPSLVLFVWYVTLRPAAEIAFYDHFVGSKIVSILETSTLYLRTDPLPPPFPIFWANVIAYAAIVAIVLWNRERARDRALAWPLPWVGLLLAGVVLVLPFRDLAEMGRPEERLMLPAALILLASGVRFRVVDRIRMLVAALAVALLLGAHALEYRAASEELEIVERETAEALPRRSSLTSLTLWSGRVHGACNREGTPSFGVPVFSWFGLERLLERGGLNAHVMSTSLIRSRREFAGKVEFSARGALPGHLREAYPEIPDRYEWVEVFACPEDLDDTENALAPEFVPARRGRFYSVMRRPDSSTRGG